MSKQVTALNTVSGVVGVVPESYLTHPVLGNTLVEVPEGTKSYDPEKYKPKTADEWRESQKSRAKSDKPAETDPSGEKAVD